MMDELKQAYSSLAVKSAYNLQNTLQALDADRTRARRIMAAKKYDCDDPKDYKERFECFAPFAGWFAPLADNDHAGTCWDSGKQRLRNDGECRNYINPTKHRVRVWIEEATDMANGQWSLNGVTLNTQNSFNVSPCLAQYQKQTCLEFDLPYDETETQVRTISYSMGGRVYETPIQVYDRLVVGLGDSYAAGEGNPDRPAHFINGKFDTDRILTAQEQIAPRKDKNGRAVWLERRCHRSMYSYQFQTALLLALKNPREAVTFISYSCTGGTTPDIINRKQRPGEGWEFRNKVPPQLPRLRKILRREDGTMRPIDYLLLSTGGNDAEFSRFVAHVVVATNLLNKIPKMIKLTLIPTSKTGDSVRKLLIGTESEDGNYQKLHRSLLINPKELVPIKTCEAGGQCSRILLNVYPTLLNDEKGELCKGEFVFDQSFWKDEERHSRIVDVQNWVALPLRDIQLNDFPALNLGWRLVKGHLPEFEKHGFCAGVKDLDAVRIPTYVPGGWKPTEPRDYNTYSVRDRWIKIPFDAKLTSDQTRRFLWFDFEFALEDDRSSIIHPTWEGLAVMADANLDEIQKQIDEERQRAVSVTTP